MEKIITFQMEQNLIYLFKWVERMIVVKLSLL